MRVSGTTEERFLKRLPSKIDKDPATGCWLWKGARSKAGYGVNAYVRGTKSAHRIVYLLLKGPIIESLVLDHLCRVPACVNPDHLEPVTSAENTRRGIASRALEGEAS